MAKHRRHSIEFKRQVAQEFLAGETLHGLCQAPRHLPESDPGSGVHMYEAGDFDEYAVAFRSAPAIRSPDRGVGTACR